MKSLPHRFPLGLAATFALVAVAGLNQSTLTEAVSRS
jgi:hypothetical protein